ncbi:DUF6752 domain-containing protein [uncultured Nocardioides sp.]|uniref:DUF6752 domain-containing protein n=1 Tax=uncultured Nocardioides sp. TaxID=198441 RepID=A0A6J4MW13_9ACTN|nr:DUF6752 domain-containing protein [uncultured Nocardioides sp.]CAA9370457.1 MAG: hypothetical protein AVDCRST_MAG06-10 [uncultured Nocardioides sp.]
MPAPPKFLTDRLAARRSLRSRVSALEEAVQENRQLNLRIAELTDAMMELVVPLSERDESKVQAVVDRYRESLGGPR